MKKANYFAKQFLAFPALETPYFLELRDYIFAYVVTHLSKGVVEYILMRINRPTPPSLIVAVMHHFPPTMVNSPISSPSS
jgi:hypothetical protein